MNSLSWLIYLADVIPSVGDMFKVFAFIAAASGVFCIIAALVESDGTDDIGTRLGKKLRKPIIILFPIFLILSAIIPERETIMMIAASEFGEEIATSAEAKNLGGKSYRALDKFLSDYLEEKQ